MFRLTSLSFPDIRFRGALRPSQSDVVKIAQEQLNSGERELHIVAPPGSGKTILGLYLWAHCIRRPAVVLSPNSAIQSQWAARLDLFDPGSPDRSIVSTDPEEIGLLTSLTYQSLTMPRRGDERWEVRAKELWIEQLIEKGHAQDVEEASVWIDDLERHNRSFYDDRLSIYRGKLRERETLMGRSFELLHQSCVDTLSRIRDAGVGLIILDECHHLMGHWGRVLADVHGYLEQPYVIGLTATPPDEQGRLAEDVQRYRRFFGPIDYEVPIPAVVRDGFLAPYQDLAYVVRPTQDELHYVANTDDAFFRLVDELMDRDAPSDTATGSANESGISGVQGEGRGGASNRRQRQYAPPDKEMLRWIYDAMFDLRLPASRFETWDEFERRDPDFALHGRQFLRHYECELPPGIPKLKQLPATDHESRVAWMTPVLDRYVRHRLRRSEETVDHELARRLTSEMRLLGYQITETGTRACASPISRILAYSRQKLQAVQSILHVEQSVLGDAIRCVIVTDFEKSSAVAAEIEDILDEEAGGAVAVFRSLLSDEQSDALDPILVTGSSVLVDDDLLPAFMAGAKHWLDDRGYDVSLSDEEHDGFHEINGRGGDWSPRVYVSLITDLFQQGLTKCLVGTRGLLGEGWDASRVNVLVDLTTVTTSMSINQLRGRSMRLDETQPEKLANNWDVVCIAPEFALGLTDYKRFAKKHRSLFGVTDDGAIEKGVAHVHPAFASLRPEELEGSERLINEDMLRRAARRSESRKLWRIGDPYHAEPVHTIEAKPGLGDEICFPPFPAQKTAWTNSSLVLAIGQSILAAMNELGILTTDSDLRVAERDGGYVRAFLENAEEEETRIFATAMSECMGPIEGARYFVPRYVDHKVATLLSRILPEVIGRYFAKRESSLAMWHTVPACLAKNKSQVAVFQRYWNRWVSPGEAIFARRQDSRELIRDAELLGKVPRHEVFQKEVFL